MGLFHFFHVYGDGDWERAAGEHLAALEYSALIDSLDAIFYGVVGCEANRRRVREIMPGECVVEADTGWEQVTLSKVRDFAQVQSGLLLYAHTKGASSRSDLAQVWRRSMIYDSVLRWREAIAGLEDADVAGSHWLKSPDPEHREHKHFFGGNFWWARMSYLRELPALRTEHRYQAEGWIGLGDPKPFVLREGFAHRHNMRQEPLPFDPVEI